MILVVHRQGFVRTEMGGIRSRAAQHGGTPRLLFVPSRDFGQGNAPPRIHRHGLGVFAFGKESRRTRTARDGRRGRADRSIRFRGCRLSITITVRTRVTAAALDDFFIVAAAVAAAVIIIVRVVRGYRLNGNSRLLPAFGFCFFVTFSLRFDYHHVLESFGAGLVHGSISLSARQVCPPLLLIRLMALLVEGWMDGWMDGWIDGAPRVLSY